MAHGAFLPAVLALISVSAAHAFEPVVCSAKVDDEWTVDVQRMSMTAKQRGETAVGILKDDEEVTNSRKWRFVLVGGQAR